MIVNALAQALNSSSVAGSAKIDTDQVTSMLTKVIVASSPEKQAEMNVIVNSVINSFDVTKNDPTNVYQALSTLTDTNDVNSVIQADKFIDSINSKVILGLEPGESSIIACSNFQIKMSKFSPNNANSISDFSTDSIEFDNITNSTNATASNRRVLFRILPTHTLGNRNTKSTPDTKSTGCAMNKNLCVDNGSLSKIIKSEVTVVSKVSPALKTALPNTQGTKPNSKDTSKIKIVATKKGRILQDIVLNVNYTTVLNINATNASDPSLASTYCATYDDDYQLINNSCLTWYNFTANKVICQCKNSGLTVNMYDATMAPLSLIYQFPAIGIQIVNPISITVLSCLIGSLLLALLIAHCKDNNSNTDEIKKQENYDVVQQCIIEYTGENFHKEIGICKLYFFLLKVKINLN